MARNTISDVFQGASDTDSDLVFDRHDSRGKIANQALGI